MSNWIETIKGTKFDFNDIDNSYVDIEIVAYSLANQNRFTGHTKERYSIAKHSVLCTFLVPKEYRYYALMHDAAEAFVGDMNNPLKQLCPDYQKIEHKVNSRLAVVFCYPEIMPKEVKTADMAMLYLEKETFFNRKDWYIDKSVIDGFDKNNLIYSILNENVAENQKDVVFSDIPSYQETCKDIGLSSYDVEMLNLKSETTIEQDKDLFLFFFEKLVKTI